MTPTRRTFVLASAAALASAGAPGAGAAATPLLPPFSPARLRADLDFLIETMVAVGVDPFVYTKRAVFDAEATRVRGELSAPMDVFSFYLRVGRLFASLSDGHLSIFAYAAFKRYRDAGGRAFPLQVTLRENDAFATETDLPAIPTGSQLLGIDGVPMSEIVDGTLGLVSGQSRALRLSFAEANNVRYYVLARYGPRASFAIRVRRPDGSTGTVVAPATTRTQLGKTLAPEQTSAQPDYTFSRLAGGRVGYIDYHACNDLKKFAAFLHDTFSQIAAHLIDGLVIDVRTNEGGNGELNDVLWSYITDKPFAQAGGVVDRSSAIVKKSFGKQKYIDVYGLDTWNAKNGALVKFSNGLTPARTNPLRYRGKVFLLIGPGTFSSAMACAVAAKDFGLATIVGEETAEPVNSNGGVFAGVAPHTGLEFGFPTQYWYAPKPRPTGQGVVPDVTIRATPGQIAKGEDPVLLYAIAHSLGMVPM